MAHEREHETYEHSVVIDRALSDDSVAICEIRDKAWIKAYPNPELGITAEDIEINAQGMKGEFVPRRITYLQKDLSEQNPADHATFVARIDGKVRGFAVPKIEAEDRCVLSMIYVEPEYQGKGIGHQLMEKALDWLGRDKDIFLEVVSYNQNAIKFYEKFGFVKTDAVVPEETGRPSYMKTLPQIEMVLKAP